MKIAENEADFKLKILHVTALIGEVRQKVDVSILEEQEKEISGENDSKDWSEDIPELRQATIKHYPVLQTNLI